MLFALEQRALSLHLPHTLVLTWEVQMQASFRPGRETGGFVSRAAKQCSKAMRQGAKQSMNAT